MQINKILLSIITLIVLFNQSGITCNCFKTQPFLNNISKNTRIIKIRVIDHRIIPNSEIRKAITQHRYPSKSKQENFPLVPYEYETYSILQVIGNYLGGEKNDTLLFLNGNGSCLLYTSPSPRDKRQSRMPSSA